MIDKLNYFSDEEQEAQKSFASKRTKFLHPFLKTLNLTGIKPDHISYIALFLLIPFSFLFISMPLLASFLLLLYVVLDGIDGALARYQKTDNLGGAFTDIVVDQMGLVVIIGNLIYHDMVSPTLAYYYGILYIVMIAFSVIQNSLKIPMQKLVRTKYVIYALYILTSIPKLSIYLESLIPSDLMYDFVILIFSLVMVITNFISYKRLKSYFSKL